MTADTPFLALWSTIFVFNIPQQRMPTIFKCPQSQISYHSRYGRKVYIEIKLEWEYVHRTVTLSMPSYVHKALHKLQHILMSDKEYSPHTSTQYNMDRNSNMQTLWMQQSISQKTKLSSFNKFVALYYNMPSLSTTILSLP